MASLTWLIDHCKVGIYVPGQIADYCAEPPRNGLSGHPTDRSWHPENIRATIFDFDKWMEDNDMPSPKEKSIITLLPHESQ